VHKGMQASCLIDASSLVLCWLASGVYGVRGLWCRIDRVKR